MPVIITFTPPQGTVRTLIRGQGCILPHRCESEGGKIHRQKLPLGSVRGIMHLDALCLYCGAHFVWVEDVDDRPDKPIAATSREEAHANDESLAVRQKSC